MRIAYEGDLTFAQKLSGYPRDVTRFPVEYPTACSPQAWATGAPLLLLVFRVDGEGRTWRGGGRRRGRREHGSSAQRASAVPMSSPAAKTTSSARMRARPPRARASTA